MKFGFFRGLLALAGAIVITASPAQAQQQYINVLTGGTSGVYYPLGVALSDLRQGHSSRQGDGTGDQGFG